MGRGAVLVVVGASVVVVVGGGGGAVVVVVGGTVVVVVGGRVVVVATGRGAGRGAGRGVAATLGTGAGAGATAALGWRKTTATQKYFTPSQVTPTPSWLKAGSRMLSRCSGEFMNAVSMSETVGPRPTFSPSLSQPDTFEPRLVVWASTPLCAIWLARVWASDCRSAEVDRARRPREVRSALVMAPRSWAAWARPTASGPHTSATRAAEATARRLSNAHSHGTGVV